MVYAYSRKHVLGRVVAIVTLFSLLMSLVPVGVLTALAAQNTGVSGIVAVFVQAAPPAGGSEYVQIKFTGFTGSAPLDLAGWTLSDEVGLRHTIVSNTALENGDTFAVCGDQSLPVVCDEEIDDGGNSVWNNSGDTLTLRDEQGEVVHVVTWGSVGTGELAGVGESSNYPAQSSDGGNDSNDNDDNAELDGDDQSDEPKRPERPQEDENPLVSECIDPSDNLLGNGSFEDPSIDSDPDDWEYVTPATWTVNALSDDALTTLEYHRDWNGNAAVEGEQYAELDPTESVKISQIATTEIGATYELSWAFAPRHNINAAENQLSVMIDGAPVATAGPASLPAGLTPADWTRQSYTFTASSESTEIAFADAGATSDSFGTFLDDARLCLVEEAPEEPPTVCSLAGNVVSFTDPVFTNGGAPVDANRRDAATALTDLADNSNFYGKESPFDPADFFSLGITGELVYEFTGAVAVDGPGDDIAIWEITGGTSGQSEEKAEVLVSATGIPGSFVSLGVATGDASFDIGATGLPYVKFVKLMDQSTNIQGNNGDGFDVDAITIINESCEGYATISASKVICTDESDLPNYGNGGPNMTETTAADWVADPENASCSLANEWEFQWGPQNAPDPGDAYVGEAGGDWTTFTNQTIVLESDLEKHLWAREVLLDGYIPFTRESEGQQNTNDVTAEFYCHTDVLNYDNRERIDGPKVGETYYCVGWNVPETPEVDEEKPDVMIESPADGAVLYDGTFVVSGTATDTDSDIDRVEYRVNHISGIGGTFVDTFDSGVANGTTSWSFPVFSAPNGFYRLRVQAFDTEGNWRYDYHDVEVTDRPIYGAYCGDGKVNQTWEQCDGEGGEYECTDYCTIANQCSSEPLLKITLDESAPASKSFNGVLYLGSASNPIPSGAWFSFDEVGDDTFVDTANAVEGLAIERDTETGQLSLAFRGDNGRTQLDYVQGTIESKGIEFGGVTRNPNPQFRLEDGGGNSFDDVFSKSGDDTMIDFDLRADTGNDGVSVAVATGTEYDCPECRAAVEVRIVLRDGEEILQAGDGNLLPQVILGDGTTVPFGEWFAVSEAPNPGDSAVWIDDAETVTNFTNPADKEGLFVSREGNGEVKVALYGFHSPGGDRNYESLRATIEFNDASVESVDDIPGQFKFENHSETDGALSNDNFDTFATQPGNTAVDFDMWVDTAADGFTVTLDAGSVAFCDDDTDPREPVEPNVYRIEGYKYDVTGEQQVPYSGWNIYAENTDDVITLATTTDGSGYFYFEVTATGTWEVTEEVLLDWEQVEVQQNGVIVDSFGDNNAYCVVNLDGTENPEDTFTCDFFNRLTDGDPETPVDPESEDNGDNGGGGDDDGNEEGTRIGARVAPDGEVQGVQTSVPSHCPFIIDHMQAAWDNDPWEVTKLQLFLNIFVDETPVTGEFDALTAERVKQFQEMHRAEILDPWVERGIVPHNRPTGFVYKTTKWKINDIVCPGYEDYPSFDGETLQENVVIR